MKLVIEICYSGYTGATLVRLVLGHKIIYSKKWKQTVAITNSSKYAYPFESDSVQESIKEYNSICESLKYSFGSEGI